MNTTAMVNAGLMLLAITIGTEQAQGTVVTFEEPDIIVDTQANSVQVGPALFSDASLYSNPNHPQLFGSGTTGLSIDTETTTATIGNGQAFDFVGAAFGSTQIPWAVGCGGYCTMEASVTLRGLYQGAVMFSSTAAAPFLSSAFANLNWDGITALQVTYTVPPPGWALGDGVTVLDNFTYNQISAVPETSATWLLAVGVGFLTVLGRRRVSGIIH